MIGTTRAEGGIAVGVFGLTGCLWGLSRIQAGECVHGVGWICPYAFDLYAEVDVMGGLRP